MHIVSLQTHDEVYKTFTSNNWPVCETQFTNVSYTFKIGNV